MTEGPPPWADSSSVPTTSSTTSKIAAPNPNASSVSAAASSSKVSGQSPYSHTPWSTPWPQNYSAYSQGANAQASASGFSTATQFTTDSSSKVYQQPASQSQSYNPYSHLIQSTHLYNSTNGATSTPPAFKPLKPPPTPPLPEPETYKHWDEVIAKFLRETKMSQALRGLENDILVINPDWERRSVPVALKELVNGLQTILDRINAKQEKDAMQNDVPVDTNDQKPIDEERPIEDRKLDYIHLSNGTKPRPQSSINKSISQFLAQTRGRNDASNRAEFLHTLAEKKRELLSAAGDISGSEVEPQAPEITSCARVDARPIDRDKQMKYDIYQNAEGPLTRSAKIDAPPAQPPNPLQPTPQTSTSTADGRTRRKRKLAAIDESMDQSPTTESSSRSQGRRSATLLEKQSDDDGVTAERHPGLDERLRNVETHLSMRYVPSLPRTLLSRLKYIEDHIVTLEKEYPPWAALHFNQPNRGWPPPPRATPIIVPPHLRSIGLAPATSADTSIPTAITSTGTIGTAKGVVGVPALELASAPPIKPRNKGSSLHKAVLDRLEVQRAMSEMNDKDGKASQGYLEA